MRAEEARIISPRAELSQARLAWRSLSDLGAADAIRGYVESLQKDGEPIPTDKPIVEELAVEVA